MFLWFQLSGLTLIGLGIAVLVQFSTITDVIEGAYQVAPTVTIIIGGIIFFIAFLGCCGAIRESNCMLVTVSFLSLIFVD